MANAKMYAVGKREKIGHIFSYYYDMAKNRLWKAEQESDKKAYQIYEKKCEKARHFFDIVQGSGEVVYASGKDFADMRNAISCYNLTH